MNRTSASRQLVFFEAELPSWESLPPDQQQALQKVLSLLLEQLVLQQTVHDSQKQSVEKYHV